MPPLAPWRGASGGKRGETQEWLVEGANDRGGGKTTKTHGWWRASARTGGRARPRGSVPAVAHGDASSGPLTVVVNPSVISIVLHNGHAKQA